MFAFSPRLFKFYLLAHVPPSKVIFVSFTVAWKALFQEGVVSIPIAHPVANGNGHVQSASGRVRSQVVPPR